MTEPLRPLLTPRDLARRFRVRPGTVTGWARAGRIEAIRTPGMRYRFTEQQVQAAQDQMETETHGNDDPGGQPPADPVTPGHDHEHPRDPGDRPRRDPTCLACWPAGCGCY